LNLRSIFEGFGYGSSGSVKLKNCSPIRTLNGFETSK
jgi:hypothetical protein